MKNKTYRYLLYVGIGMILYYALEGKEGEGSLDQIHTYAPWAILGIVMLMMIMKVVKERKTRGDE